MSGPSFARLAVVQLDFHPAAILSDRSLLQDPRGSEDELLAIPESLPQLDNDWKSLRKRVAEAYLASFRPKLEAILDACKAWDVNLVVFPEYSIPWELLQSVARPGMTIVAGTHSVTSQSRKSGVYGELDLPAAGTAVAPVFEGNGLMHLSGKQSPSKEETRGGFKSSPQWEPVKLEGPVGAAGPLAVMICIDFINRETEAYRERVGPQLSETGLIALPTYTPWHSLDNFSEQARTEAFRLERPVLWANCAAHGGTTIIVDDDPKAPSSSNLPVFGCGEEGVLVADVDLGTQRRGKRTTFDEQPVVRLVASAGLAYQHTTEQQAYAQWSEDLARRAASDAADLDTLMEWIQGNDALLVKTIGLDGALTRSKRLRELRARSEFVSSAEKLLTSTREIVLPPKVLPLSYVQHGLALGAKRLIAQWRDVHRYGLETFEIRLDAVVRAQPIENITAAAKAAIEEIAQQVTGPLPEAAGRPPNDAIMARLAARLVVGESDVDKALDENTTEELEGELQTKIADLEHILASSSEANDSHLQKLALNRLELARLLLNLQRSEESTPLLEQVDEKHLEPKSIAVFARMWAACGSPERASALLNRVGEEERSSHYDQALLAVGLANGELPGELPDDPTQQIDIASYHLRRGDFAEAARVALLAIPKVRERAQSVLVPYVVLVHALYDTVFEAPGRTSGIGVTKRLEVIETLASLRDTHLGTWLGSAASGTAELRAMVVNTTAAFHEVINEREAWPQIHRDDEDARASDRATDVAKAGDLEAALDQMPSAGTQPWIDELRRANLRMASGDIDGAIRDARALAERYPHRGPIEYFLAALLYNRDDHEGARVHAGRAYQQVPGGGFRSLFVICLESTGDVSRAWSLVEPTLEHAGPHALRVAAFVAQKAVPQQAASLWKRYLDAVPEAHNDRVQYARVLFHDGKTGQAAEQARHAVEGSKQSLPAHLLYLAAQLQLNADGSMLPARSEVVKAIAIELGERFSNDPDAEAMRVQLSGIAGVETEPNLPLLVQGGHAFTIDLNAGVPQWLEQAKMLADVQHRLYDEGGVTLGGLAIARKCPYAEVFLDLWTKKGAAFCAPLPKGEPPAFMRQGLTLIVGPIELLLLAHLELFDALKAAHEKYGLQLVLPQTELARLKDEVVHAPSSTAPGLRALREEVSSWLTATWILGQTWKELTEEVEVPVLPGLKIEQSWAEELVKRPLEQRLKQAAALRREHNRRVLTVDSFATDGIGSIDVALAFAWPERAQGEAITEFLRDASSGFLSVPALVRMLAGEGFVSERKALQTRRRLAEKGFGDALDGGDLVFLASKTPGPAALFDEDHPVLQGLESVARNPSIYLRPIGEMSLSGTYAKAIFEGALGPASKDVLQPSPGSTRRSPAALPPAAARSMISILLGRLERLDGANNGPLVEYALSFVGVQLVERLADSFEKSPTDAEWMVISAETPTGKLWQALYDWAGPSGRRRNALDRAVVDAWVTLDRVSPAAGPGPRAGPLMLAASVTDGESADEGKRALALKHEAVAILSATWEEPPLANYTQALIFSSKDDPVVVQGERVLKYGAEHTAFDEFGDGRYTWIDYQEPPLPIPYPILAPLDALVLRAKGERFKEGVQHLVAKFGGEDGIALRLLMTLLQEPSDDARRKYAQYSVDALWRNVRSDPRYLAVWPRKFQHALEEYPSLRMLSEILHETRPALPQGALETLMARLEQWRPLAPAVRDTLAGHASRLPGILRFQPGPDPKNHAVVEAFVQRSVGRLEEPGQHPAGSLASDVRFLLLTLARGTTVVELDQGTEDLRELLPRLWGQVLDFEAHRGLMVDYEEDLLRACGSVVLDLSFRTPRRTAADFLWLTYRLHAWLTEQIRLSDPEKRKPGILALVEATRRREERPSLALDQMFNPFEFTRFGFEYRKAVLLSAFITGIEMARDELGDKSDFFPFSLGLERRLLEIARAEARESEDVPAESWIDWPLPLAVPDLAASILLRTNPGRIVTDDASALLRRIKGWPSELSTLRLGEQLFALDLSRTLGFGISQLDTNLVDAYAGWIRTLDPMDPQNQNARVIGVLALFGHGEDGLKDQARALAREEITNDQAWTLLGHFFSGIAREGADLVVAEARAFLAYADQQDGEKRGQVRENLAVALARVATQATDQRSVVAIEAMRTLSEDAASSNWERLRVLLAHVQSAGES